MREIDSLIQQLQLEAHPEGGFFRETYRSRETTAHDIAPYGFQGPRNFCTSIYFLLTSQERSLLHRIKSDEIWHYHAGTSLSIYIFYRGTFAARKLGSDPANGDSFQVVVPAGAWFGAKVDDPDSFTLSGCTVSPGFDFRDFEMASRGKILKEYPEYSKVIEMLTKGE